MQKNLLLIIILMSALTSKAQWNSDPTENNLVVSVDQKGTGQVTAPVTVSDGSGGMFIAWVDGRNSVTTGNDVFVIRVLASGTIAPGFAAGGNPVCLATGTQSNPVMVEDGQGGVVITWTDARNTATNSNDIFAQRINASGVAQWTENGVEVIATAVNENTPSIALISGVEVAIIWRFTGTGTDLAFNYLALTNGSKSLASDIVITSEGNNQTNQQVVPDGNGGVIVVWSDGRVSNATSGVVAQRYNAGGIRLWAEGGAIVRAPGGSNTTSPQMIGDGTGGAVFVWSDSKNGATNSDIYTQRLNTGGEPEWGVDPKQVTSATGQQLNPTIIKSGANFILGWNDQQNGGASNTDLYAQAYSAAGTALWNTGNPFAVVTEADQQPLLGNAPVVVEDGSGGAIFIWDDRKNTATNIDIYAQRVSAAGAKQWAEAGVPIATRTGSNQRDPMAVMGSGTLINIAWRDSRSGNTSAELYASQLTLDGTLPVTILEIGATQQGKMVNVTWTTTGESNLANYRIERSVNGAAFKETGLVKAKNTQGMHQYAMLDPTPVSGNNFYRVKSVNLDGSYKYSAIVKVNMVYLSDKNVHLYPNPVVAGLNLQLNNLPAGSYQVHIVDIAGKSIQRINLQKGASDQTFSIDAGKLAQGYYQLQVMNESNESVSVKPLMKR